MRANILAVAALAGACSASTEPPQPPQSPSTAIHTPTSPKTFQEELAALLEDPASEVQVANGQPSDRLLPHTIVCWAAKTDKGDPDVRCRVPSGKTESVDNIDLPGIP